MKTTSKTVARSSGQEAWTFFRQWLRRPLATAAVSPSSRFLAKRIIAALPPGTRRVIELGPGTGTFTHALIEHGIDTDNLLAVEFNPALHQYLRTHFPGLQVVEGDARALPEVAEVRAFAQHAPVQAVVSGLGLLGMSKDNQRAVLEGAFGLMAENGVFVQFTYGPVAPVASEILREMQLHAVRRSFTLLNLPPASVYTFVRKRSVAVPGVSF